MPQVVGHVLRRRVPVRRPLRQRLQTNSLQFLRDGVVVLAGRARLEGRDLLQQLGLRVGLERPPPDEQLVEHDTQTEDVTAPVHPVPFTACLLRGHVGGRAGEPRPRAHVLLTQGQPEVRHERLVRFVEEDVARLDVPVNQPVLVGVVQRLGHRRHEFHGLVQRHTGLLEPPGEVGAVDELRHDEAREPLGAAHVEHGQDVRVVEAGDGAGFLQVRFGLVGPGHQARVRHLDRHRAVQLVVVRQVDQPEPAPAQHPLDAVAADLLG